MIDHRSTPDRMLLLDISGQRSHPDRGVLPPVGTGTPTLRTELFCWTSQRRLLVLAMFNNGDCCMRPLLPVLSDIGLGVVSLRKYQSSYILYVVPVRGSGRYFRTEAIRSTSAMGGYNPPRHGYEVITVHTYSVRKYMRTSRSPRVQSLLGQDTHKQL